MLWLQNEATKEIHFPENNSFCHIPQGTYLLSVKIGTMHSTACKRSISKPDLLHTSDDDDDDDDDVIFVKEEPSTKRMKPQATCLVCHKDTPVKPVLALCCNQILGCSGCVNTWLLKTDCCPLCRHQKPKTIFVKGFGN